MRSYLETRALEKIRGAGGEVFAVTSEPQSLATEAQNSWSTEFTAVGDPHHEIRAECAQRGWVDVFTNTIPGEKNPGFFSAHPKGFFQPAVLALHKSGRILYRWRCVPKHSNLSGAGPRPEANYIWRKIQEGMHNDLDAELDKNPELGEKPLPWHRFLLIILANGWFLKPKTFALSREGEEKRPLAADMAPRIYGFAALWLLLLLLIPLGWVAFLAIIWIAKVTPGLMEIYRLFPQEPDPY